MLVPHLVPYDGIERPDFHSDGCTGVPDGDWAECCTIHDYAYWVGHAPTRARRGDPARVSFRAWLAWRWRQFRFRRWADGLLGSCITRRKKRPIIGALYGRGVRALGWPAFLAHRWRQGTAPAIDTFRPPGGWSHGKEEAG